MLKTIRVVIAVSCVLTASSTGGRVVDWLYDVDVVIADRSVEARAAAAADALRGVLVRLSGAGELPASPVLNAALRTPDRFYVRYGFAEETVDGQTVTKLRVRFAESAILRLLAEAGLPLWSSNRPVLMVWAAVDAPVDAAVVGARPVEILTAASTHPMAKAVELRARERGLPVVLPAMDLDDELSVSVETILSGDIALLLEAAQRYRADGVLLLRVQGGVDGPWSVAGRMVLLDQEREIRDAPATLDALARIAVDPAVDMLAARYAVVAGDGGRLEFRIDGVSDLAQYASVLRYLEGLEFIDHVNVDRVERHSLHVSVFTRTPWGQLKDLFDLDGRLVALSSAAFGLGDRIPLLWRDDSR